MTTKNKTNNNNNMTLKLHVAKLFGINYKRLVGQYKEFADFLIDEFIVYFDSIDISEKEIMLLKKDDTSDDMVRMFLNTRGYEAFRFKYFPDYDYEEYEVLFYPINFMEFVNQIRSIYDRADQTFPTVTYSREWLIAYLNSDEFRQNKYFQLQLLRYFIDMLNIVDPGKDFLQFVASYHLEETKSNDECWMRCTYAPLIPMIYLYREEILNSLDPEMSRFYESKCPEAANDTTITYIPVRASKVADGGMSMPELRRSDIENWTYTLDSAMPYDPRQYKAVVATEPKKDTKFYDENLLYFKNVAFPFFFTYIRSMNFTIDSLEKHSFFFHFGRQTFIHWVIGILVWSAIIIFIIRMVNYQ